MSEETLVNKARQIQVKNILSKLNSGKTITAREQKLLEDYEQSKKPVSKDEYTWPQIALILGVSRTALTKWRKRPDAPDSRDPEVWKQFVEDKDLGVAPNTVGKSKGRDELLSEKLRREIALLDIKVATARRQVIAADEIDSLLGRIASGQRAELIQWCETESPIIIAGGDLGEIRDNQRQMCDRLCDIMQGGIKRWLAQTAKPQAVSND